MIDVSLNEQVDQLRPFHHSPKQLLRLPVIYSAHSAISSREKVSERTAAISLIEVNEQVGIDDDGASVLAMTPPFHVRARLGFGQFRPMGIEKTPQRLDHRLLFVGDPAVAHGLNQLVREVVRTLELERLHSSHSRFSASNVPLDSCHP